MSSPRAKGPRTLKTKAAAGDGPVVISKPDKLLFPAIGLTRGGLAEYYERIAPLLLPHLRDRPLTLERCPDGLSGDDAPRFWQKNTPTYYPSFIPRVNLPTEEGKPVLYALCNDVDTLRYLVNQGTIALHVWGSRAATPDTPDYVLFDLDPGSAPFSQVVTLAHVLRSALERDGHRVYVKTSGKSGLHLLVPWQKAGGYPEARAFATAVGKSVIAAQPELATLEIRKERRGGRIYLDVMQNVRGHHVVPAYVVRAVPTATVSMPLSWDEVDDKLDPARFTTQAALERVATAGELLAGLTELYRARS
jgi:bifunctional non-homologous end joining protein LigD